MISSKQTAQSSAEAMNSRKSILVNGGIPDGLLTRMRASSATKQDTAINRQEAIKGATILLLFFAKNKDQPTR